MGDFKEEFEAWCAGPKDEPFEWQVTAKDGFVASSRVKPKVSVWQRFWRSPWTWLVLAVNQAVGVIPHAHGWLGVVAAWGFLILFVVNFTEAANKRWGKP